MLVGTAAAATGALRPAATGGVRPTPFVVFVSGAEKREMMGFGSVGLLVVVGVLGVL